MLIRSLSLCLAGLLAGLSWWSSQPASDSVNWEAALRPFEKQLLARRVAQGSDERGRGAEPWRMLRLSSPDRTLVLLRHTSEVVLLDQRMQLLDRLATPRSPSALAQLPSGNVVVAGDLSNELLVLESGPESLTQVARVEVQELVSVRDLVTIGGQLYLIDDFLRRLVVGRLPGAGSSISWQSDGSYPVGAGASQLLVVENNVLALLLQHEQQIELLPLGPNGPLFGESSRIQFEGPLFRLSVGTWGSGTWLIAGGLENRPLDRTGGEFGYVDSFVFGFRLERNAAGRLQWRPEWRSNPNRSFELNVSELEVVTPRAILAESGERPSLWVAGFGSGTLVRLERDRSWRVAERRSIPAGVEQLVAEPGREGSELLAVSSLDDSLIRFGAHGETRRWRPDDPITRDPRERLGELLFFTTLLTPENRSTAGLSRFTCEACHLEGGIDGRVHYTGREAIHASTKTLRGLADNVPLFSRGGDADLSSMVPAEFDAANQQRKSLFTLRKSHTGWLAEWPGIGQTVGPLEQREALMAFLISFDHRPNPWRLAHPSMDNDARAGMSVFRGRCEHCHQAQDTNRERSPVPFSAWSLRLAGRGPDPVWGAPFFSKTGIEPYVDPAGARVTSLRRVWTKTPYFTNGSSSSIEDVLERFRYRDLEAWHHMADDSEPRVSALSADERRQLEALLLYF